MAPSYDFCVLMPVPVQQEGTATLAKLLNGGLQVQCSSIPALYAQGHRDPRQNPTFPGSTTGFATGWETEKTAPANVRFTDRGGPHECATVILPTF